MQLRHPGSRDFASMGTKVIAAMYARAPGAGRGDSDEQTLQQEKRRVSRHGRAGPRGPHGLSPAAVCRIKS